MYKFNTYTNAKNFADHAKKIWSIMLGDDDLYWVVTPATARKLASQGYQYAD